MAWLPKSRKARRRLTIVVLAGVVLSAATALVFVALGDATSMYLTPSQVAAANLPPQRHIQLGGFVEKGTLQHHPDGSVEFIVTDYTQTAKVTYQGDLPDLFRECQGVVAKGAFDSPGNFRATQILAKHDEKYQPRELEKVLKESGASEKAMTADNNCPAAPQQMSAK